MGHEEASEEPGYRLVEGIMRPVPVGLGQVPHLGRRNCRLSPRAVFCTAGALCGGNFIISGASPRPLLALHPMGSGPFSVW